MTWDLESEGGCDSCDLLVADCRIGALEVERGGNGVAELDNWRFQDWGLEMAGTMKKLRRHLRPRLRVPPYSGRWRIRFSLCVLIL